MGADGIGAVQTLFVALALFEHELLLFASFWLFVGILDELAIDLCWLVLRLRGKCRDRCLTAEEEELPLRGNMAVLVPAWQEHNVIADMIRHALAVWPQPGLRLYVGCYCNDPETRLAAERGAGGDARVRLIVHERPGPTTKADCLNRLYRALEEDEELGGISCEGVILHDAEDMVHPAELTVIDKALQQADFVQLPVRPEIQKASQWIGGHYCDEFAEDHAKAMVVRDALKAALPAAGVGCGFSRSVLARLAEDRRNRGETGPFAADSLTEDYELGLLASRWGAGGRFLRLRDRKGDLVATRAFFPATLSASVRQKTRWIHGIALQGWDRLGWSLRPIDLWMALRDRRGPLTAFVLATCYGLLVLEGVLSLAGLFGGVGLVAPKPVLQMMLRICLAGLIWRVCWRFAFTALEYGLPDGIRAVFRLPVANIIAIMAGRRALFSYMRTLRGAQPLWDKTHHDLHPATFTPSGRA